MRRAIPSIALALSIGIVATILIAWASAYVVDLSLFPAQSAQSFDGETQWTIAVAQMPLGTRITSTRNANLNWSPRQATGKPDTPIMGDITSAWASATQDGQKEWLDLIYDPPVKPTSIEIYESYNPGAIAKVTLFDKRDHPTIVRDVKIAPTTAPSTQPTTTPTKTTAPIIAVPSNLTVTTSRVRLNIDSPAIPGWNEIDAVGLRDAGGAVQWASSARASSFYGAGTGSGFAGATPPKSVGDILPNWAGPLDAGSTNTGSPPQDRIIEARGWPMPALRADATVLIAGRTIYPLRPIWPGFVADVIVFGAIALCLGWLFILPRRFVTESMRLRRGRCMRCGYDLQFDLHSGCPECGWRRESSETRISG